MIAIAISSSGKREAGLCRTAHGRMARTDSTSAPSASTTPRIAPPKPRAIVAVTVICFRSASAVRLVDLPDPLVEPVGRRRRARPGRRTRRRPCRTGCRSDRGSRRRARPARSVFELPPTARPLPPAFGAGKHRVSLRRRRRRPAPAAAPSCPARTRWCARARCPWFSVVEIARPASDIRPAISVTRIALAMTTSIMVVPCFAR